MEKLSEITQLKKTNEFSQCLKSINSIISLLDNKKLWAEYNLLKSLTPKIAIRIRNSPYSRSLEQLLKSTTDIKSSAESSLFKDIKSFLENFSGETEDLSKKVETYGNQIECLGKKLFLIVILATKAFKLAQVWLNLGQLINHFLMISCVTSRLSIYSKALLVYLYDVYQIVLRLRQFFFPNDIKSDQMKSYLLKLNIKLRATTVKKLPNKLKPADSLDTSNSKIDSKELVNETELKCTNHIDLGVALDRESYAKELSPNLRIQPANKNNSKKKCNNRKKEPFSKDNKNSLSKSSNAIYSKINQQKNEKLQQSSVNKKALHKNVLGAQGPKKKNNKNKVNSFKAK